MKTLGEQWIEEIDGVRHMVKVVKGDGITTCMGCFYFDNYDKDCKNPVGEAQCSEGIIKDLGPMNEEGCLAEERTGIFPKFDFIKKFDMPWRAFVVTDDVYVVCYGKTKQQAIDAWNRRAM